MCILIEEQTFGMITQRSQILKTLFINREKPGASDAYYNLDWCFPLVYEVERYTPSQIFESFIQSSKFINLHF